MSNTDVQQANAGFVRSIFGTAMRDATFAESFFSNDFVCHVAEGLPYGRDYHGPKGYLELLEHIKKFWSDIRQISPEFIPFGEDKVIIHFTLEGHMAKNGQYLHMPVVAVWELAGGKVRKIRIFYFDTKRVSELAAM